MTELLLVRHGESVWNREGRWQGHADPPLTDEGRRQARALAGELAALDPVAVYSSDLVRARETAEIVAAPLGLGVKTTRDLREIDVGEWQGLTWAELESRYPDGVARHREGIPGWKHGESQEHLGERVLSALRQIECEHPEERVVVVTHGGPLRTAAALAAGVSPREHRRRDPRLDHCAVVRVAFRDGELRGLD